MPTNFITDYLEYADGNECPPMFHLWGAMTALSAAVSRKVWLPFEDTAIFPNLYVMYVGDAGNGKSWAMAKCKRLLAAIGAPYSGSLETPPGMWRYMAGNPDSDPPKPSPVKFATRWPDGQIRDCHPMTVIANEFINFISLDEKGWVNALNDIYDEDDYKYRTKNMGEDNLIGPYIVLLGALTTEVSSDLQKARIISTGLARRTLFQYGQRQFHNPHALPKFTDAQKAARERCLTHMRLLQLSATTGAFDWSDEVNNWWELWYGPQLAAVPTRNPSVRSWYASKSVQLMKIAMLLSLARDATLHLIVEDFEMARLYLEKLEEDLPKIFGGVGRNELAGVAMKMLEYVQYLPEPMLFEKFKSQFFTSCRPPHDFDECINFLLSSKQLVRSTFMLGVADAYDNVQTKLADVIATPKTMQAFVAMQIARLQTAPPVSLSGPASSIDPSTAPSSTLPNPVTSNPIAAQPDGETATAEPPTQTSGQD